MLNRSNFPLDIGLGLRDTNRLWYMCVVKLAYLNSAATLFCKPIIHLP